MIPQGYNLARCPGSRLTALGGVGLLLVACGGGSSDRLPPVSSEGGSGSGASSAGGSAGSAASGGSGASGGASGSGASGGSAASGGSGGSAVGGNGGSAASGGVSNAECGNRVAEAGEECDDTDLRENTCATVGFEIGELKCSECALDTSSCSGVERCTDGRDNDGDAALDCDDSDCAAECANACVAPPDLSDPAVVDGSTAGHTLEVVPSCTNRAGVSYRFVAAHTGVFEARVTSQGQLGLALHGGCAKAAGEITCADTDHLKLEVAAGQEWWLSVVESERNASSAGFDFQLDVQSRVISCGDGYRDGNEECDDAGKLDNDGCSSQCKLESSEGSSNDTPATSDPFTTPYFGSIGSSGDVDVMKVVVTQAKSSIVVDTFDFGDGACSRNELDSYLEILAPDGTTVLASDDDSGEGYCARASIGGLDPGTYFVRVQASTAGDTPTFNYRLSAVVDRCGNGNQVETEECDDGGNVPWDGCDADCKLE